MRLSGYGNTPLIAARRMQVQWGMLQLAQPSFSAVSLKVRVLIFHTQQEQAARRSRRTGGNVALRRQASLDVGSREIPLPYFEQHAHDITHHVLQEAASPYTIDEPVAGALGARRIDAPDVRQVF